MVQTRTVEYGAAIHSSDMPFDISSIMSAGRLVGMTLSASAADQIAVTPGTVLMPDGVLVHEDEVKYLQVANTAFAVNYSIVYTLQSTEVIGGSPADLNLVAGIVKQDDLTDSTVLGWVLYPGGAAALDESFLIEADTIRVEPRSAELDALYLPPFPEALRPPEERRGSMQVRGSRLSNLNSTSTITQVAGIAGRIVSASVVTDASIAANGSNYDVLSVVRSFAVTGSTTALNPNITNVSDVSRIYVGQGVSGTGIPSGATVGGISGSTVTMSANATATVTGGTVVFSEALFSLSTQSTSLVGSVASQLTKASVVASRFQVRSTDTLSVRSQMTGVVPGTIPGEISYVYESPGSTGNWEESIVPLGNETVNRWQNLSAGLLTYLLKVPFVITGVGKFNKLVARLNVESNTIVTFNVRVGGTSITLSPVSGTVANTGGLVTVELLIPSVTGVTWEVGKVGYVEMSIQAQGGGAAALAYLGLTTENYPYTLFVGGVT